MAGLKLEVGVDLSTFRKDISFINKELTTVAGQKYFVNIDFASAIKGSSSAAKKIRQELVAVQGELKTAMSNVSKVLYEKKGSVINVQDVKSAVSALSYLNKELRKAKKEGNTIKINSLSNDIATINEYRDALKKASDAAARAGIASTPASTAQMKFDRAALDAQIKLIEKKRALLNGNTNISESAKLQEEIKLQQQLVNLLQKKSETYKGTNKRNAQALYSAQTELEDLRVRKRQVTEAEKLASVQQRINALNKARGNISQYDKKITQLREETSIVNKLITQWQRYLEIATRANNKKGVQTANAKLSALEKERIALRNLATEEQRRIVATNQNKSLLNDQGRLLGKLKTLAANYVSVFAVLNFGKKIVETTGYFEQQKVALQGILGSAAAAQQAMNELKGMALKSPFELKNLVGFTKQLSAYGIEVENLLPITKQLADISTGLGVDMGRLILAYGQVKSAAVLRGQELRQFTEAGIPMVAELAKKFTDLNGRLVTTGEVFELISKRKVPFEMVASVMSDLTKEGGKFYKMQENITDTLYGQVQKLKDMWTISLNDIGSGMGKVLRGFISLLQGVVKNFRAVLITISGIATANVIKLMVKNIAQMRAQLNAATTAAGRLRIAVGGIGKALTSNLFIAAFSALIGVIASAIQKAIEFGKTMKDIEISFAKDTAKYVQGFDTLIGKLSSMTEGTKEYNEAIDTLKSNYGEFINPAMISHLIAERKQLDDTAEGWGRLRDSVVAAIQAEKDYEKHKAKKDEAGNQIVNDAKSLEKLFRKELTQQLSRYKATQDASADWSVRNDGGNSIKLDYYNKIYSGVKSSKTQEAYVSALESFFRQDTITKEKLQEEIGKSFERSGVAINVTQYVIDNIDKIWKNISDTKKFKKFEEENEIIENNPFNIINKRFEEAQRITAGRQEGRWVAGMANKDYNPARLSQAEDYDYAIAVKDLIEKVAESIAKKRVYKDDTTLFSDKENGYDTYNKALESFRKQVNGISTESFSAAGKTKEIAVALQNLANTIEDSKLLSQLSKIQESFIKLAGVKTGRAASISTAIEEDFLDSGVLSHETKDIYKKYVPTDATIEELRNSIKTEYDNLTNIIESYGETQGNEANAEYVKTLKEEVHILKTLAGEKYYDIDLSEKGRAVTLRTELSEFINRLKKAYDTYKNSVQKGGIEFGLGYVRNDEQVKNMFGEFFGGDNSELFQKLNELRVGNKTAGSILRDKFITEGLENGILDFEEAAKSLAKELMDYYKGDKQHRLSFKTAAEQLLKWVETTIAKDNLSRALAELEKEIKDLSFSFEKTTKNVDLYRQLIQNGTLETVGAGLRITRSQATEPESERQKRNIAAVIDKYNQQLGVVSNGQSSPYAIESLNNINDLYAALSKLGELRKMNEENFSATELGQTSATVENLIKQLIETIIKEMTDISGKVYTGNTLKDLMANSAIEIKADKFTLGGKERNAIAKGQFDYEAVKSFVTSNKDRGTAIYDQFLKDNRFDVLANGKLGKIEVDFDALKEKFEDIFKDIPAELKSELEKKLADLKISVQTYNSSIGSLGSFGDALKTYRDAGATAKVEYDRTKGNVATIQQQLDSGTNILTGAPLTAAETAQLNAELASAKAYLEELGEDGANLAEKLKQVSVENMIASLNKANKSVGDLSSAVTATVSAAKSLVSAVNKVYDVMNDGENPTWMQDAEAFLDDFGEMFEQLVMPITAVISMISALTVAITICEAAAAPLIIITAVLIAAAAIIAGIVAAIQQHDRALERQNEELEKQIEETENAMKNLNAAAERMTGFDKFNTQLKEVGLNLDNYTKSIEKARNEEKKKNTDKDKVKEYVQDAQESLDDFYNGLKDLRDELTNSVESWADSISSALRDAFQNGENAARAIRTTIKEMIGDIIEEIMKMSILEPLVEGAMNDFLGGSVEQIKERYTNSKGQFDSEGYSKYLKSLYDDPKKLAKLEEGMNNAALTYQDAHDSLSKKAKEYFDFNSERSDLSGGIESITEDTARALEGLANSQLSVTIQIRQLLENYVNSVGGSASSSTIAGIQTHVSQINNNVALILRGMQELRNTNVRPLHVTVV